ncbi:hypothetical protein R1sor_011819 [Riccia sorocarpa]|uniref:C2 domain-containing protein n=1 Tax=Riccia sorocarpa TaxID=122646 RepID=A0ABD3I229_9MARC
MSAPKDRTVEVTIISASHLKKVRLVGHQKLYVVAYIYEDHKFTSKVDRDGGLNPTWNSHLTLKCDERLFVHHGTYLNFKIYRRGQVSKMMHGSLIGTVAVPLRDLEKDVRCHVEATPMSFQVRRSSGRENGVLNLAIKLGSRQNTTTEGHLAFHAPRFEHKRVDQADDSNSDGESVGRFYMAYAIYLKVNKLATL